MDAYDGEFLRIAERAGLVLDADGRWTRSPSYQGPNPPSDERIRYLNASTPKYQTNPRLECQWVENFAHIAEGVARDGDATSAPTAAVFWIRLHGVIAELLPEGENVLRSIGIESVLIRPRSGERARGNPAGASGDERATASVHRRRADLRGLSAANGSAPHAGSVRGALVEQEARHRGPPQDLLAGPA